MNNGAKSPKNFAAPRDSSEAISMNDYDPTRTKSAQTPGIYKGASPLYTFSSVHFFVV